MYSYVWNDLCDISYKISYNVSILFKFFNKNLKYDIAYSLVGFLLAIMEYTNKMELDLVELLVKTNHRHVEQCALIGKVISTLQGKGKGLSKGK